MAVGLLACGLILDTVTHSRREIKRLAYLEGRAPQWPASAARAAGGVELSAMRGAYGPRAQNDAASAAVPAMPAAAS
jgi:hypothetical protein